MTKAVRQSASHRMRSTVINSLFPITKFHPIDINQDATVRYQRTHPGLSYAESSFGLLNKLKPHPLLSAL